MFYFYPRYQLLMHRLQLNLEIPSYSRYNIRLFCTSMRLLSLTKSIVICL